jgi:hypothetical protein
MAHSPNFERRNLLKGIGAAAPLLLLNPLTAIAARRRSNPIIAENQMPGTRDWLPFPYASNHEIEGYASAASVAPGRRIRIFVNTAEPTFQLEVFRLGWYGGDGGRRVFGPVTLEGRVQATPAPHPVTGLVDCDWTDPFTLRTDRDWVSGVYLVKLTASATQSLVPFVLTDDRSRAPLLFQSSVTTHQAYNNWGGKSLYSFNSVGPAAVKVSFNRPYANGKGAGELFSWELSLLRFLEREGYDVGYCTNVTTHSEPSTLRDRSAFLSVGHDEYWSLEMRENVVAARNRGVNLGFFSANTCYWQIRLESSRARGASDRIMVCYKERAQGEDPLFGVDDARVTTLWRNAPVNRPEEQLLGVQFDGRFYPVDTDIVVDDPSHFIFEGTGLRIGDRLPGLLGYEADRIFGGGPPNLIRLCHSPVNLDDAPDGFSDMTIYSAPSGALVFATGSMQFNWGLDDGEDSTRADLVNPAAQQMARNLIARFLSTS